MNNKLSSNITENHSQTSKIKFHQKFNITWVGILKAVRIFPTACPTPTVELLQQNNNVEQQTK